MMNLNDDRDTAEGGIPQQFQQGPPPQMFQPDQSNMLGNMAQALQPMAPNAFQQPAPAQRDLDETEQTTIAYLDAVGDMIEAVKFNMPVLAPVMDQALMIMKQGVAVYLQTGSVIPGGGPPMQAPPAFGQGEGGPAPAFGGGLEGVGPENIPLPPL